MGTSRVVRGTYVRMRSTISLTRPVPKSVNIDKQRRYDENGQVESAYDFYKHLFFNSFPHSSQTYL